MPSAVLIIPEAQRDKANALGEALGHGPNNYSVALSPTGSEPATHWGGRGEERPLSSFYSYGYTTKQGKASTRYESRCIECSKARRKADYRANPDRDAAASQRWRDANRSRISAYNSARQTSPAHRANKAKAQRIRKATLRSGEGSSDAIKAIYAEAIRIEQLVSCCPVFGLPELGYKMHVDHIIPLSKGGRHVASNLQILPAGLNLRKGTKCPL